MMLETNFVRSRWNEAFGAAVVAGLSLSAQSHCA